jgi:hypothetical protein
VARVPWRDLPAQTHQRGRGFCQGCGLNPEPCPLDGCGARVHHVFVRGQVGRDSLCEAGHSGMALLEATWRRQMREARESVT